MPSPEAQAALAALKGWSSAREGKAIARTFDFADFSEAFAFMTRCALAAEKLDHHPEWSNVYGRVEIILTTHDAAGLTSLDFQLARRIDRFRRTILTPRLPSGRAMPTWSLRMEETVATQRNDATARDESRVRAGFWRTAKRAARHVPFMEEVVAAYYCALDRNTPMRVKGILFVSLAYFVLPTDVVPDFLLGIGFTDDIAVLSGAIASIRQHIKPAHRQAAKKALRPPS